MRFRIFLLFSCLVYACTGSNTNALEELAANDNKELTNVASQLLKQKQIKSLTIFADYDSTKCQSINSWRNCPSVSNKWETWSDSLQTKIYLNSRLDVLRYEHIDVKTFNYFHDFLQKEELTTAIIYQSNFVEFESYTNGLRYYPFRPNQLKENFEYLYVKRLNENWFVYRRDWN